MLRVSLLGNLGGDPEVRYTPKGTQMATFRVAVNQVRTGPDGERQENTEWFRVRATGRLSEFGQRLNKGSRVLVIGRLDISHYQAKDGETRTGFDVWADEIQAMGARPSMVGPEAESEALEPAMAGVSSMSGNGGAARGRPARAAAAANGASSDDLEDLPF